jgi:hypothetical protein
VPEIQEDEFSMAGVDKEFAREIKITDYPVFNKKKQPISFVLKPNQPIAIDMKIFYKVMKTSVVNAVLTIIQQAKLRLKMHANKTPVGCWWLRHEEQTGVILIHNTRDNSMKHLAVKIKCKLENEYLFDIPKLRAKEAIQLDLNQINSCQDAGTRLLVKNVEIGVGKVTYHFENIDNRFIERV